MVIREINNTGGPLLNAAGLPLSAVDIIFTIVDAQGKPSDAYDIHTGERITGVTRVRTDTEGLFTVNLWPTTRADKPVYYQTHVNYTGYRDFIAGLQEGPIAISFMEFKSFGRAAKPLEDQLIQKTLDDILDLFGKGAYKVNVGFGGVDLFQVVILTTSGNVIPADPTDVSHAGKVYGITLQAALGGDVTTICRSGSVSNDNWLLSPSNTYYLDLGGGITDVMPTTGFMQPLGIAETTNTLFLHISEPIIL